MMLENLKILTDRARELYGTQKNFCDKNNYQEYNFPAIKKRALKNLEKITIPLGLDILLVRKKSDNLSRTEICSDSEKVSLNDTVGFAVWVENRCCMVTKDVWTCDIDNHSKDYSTLELFKIYLNNKFNTGNEQNI